MIQKGLGILANLLLKEKRQKDRFLKFLFQILNRDPIMFAYNNAGILNYQNDIISGEKNLIKNVLPEYLKKNEYHILFDVGANSGNYTENLAQTFPNSTIYSFEPNQNSFEKLKANFRKKNKIHCHQIGFSNERSTKLLYTYSGELDSQHASVYKNVLTDIHIAKEISSFTIELFCLDDFCRDHNINFIDFIKIDTEGNEFDVLKGASKMIKAGKIKIIQFEFNEMNVVSRVFLKDFYNLLPNYDIYRLTQDRLVAMTNYSTLNEIFQFQNLVAIQKGTANV